MSRRYEVERRRAGRWSKRVDRRVGPDEKQEDRADDAGWEEMGGSEVER